MAAKQETKTLTKKPSAEEHAPDHVQELPTQRKRPETGQFHLQVDRQTKRSFTTAEAAEAAGLAIKKAHPIVQVAVYDIVESANKIIEVA
jgi:ribosomal protein L13E